MAMNSKVLFFLRHYNDIDQMTPVIWKWAQTDGAKASVVISHTAGILEDYRIKLLQGMANVEVSLLSELTDMNPASGNVKEEAFADRILDETMAGVDKGLLAFDWISDNMTAYLEFARPLCSKARERGFQAVSLPHGDEPHMCKMLRRDELEPAQADIYTQAQTLFDNVVVPNELCAVRYRHHMGNERVKVLGSPRYNDEWLRRIHNLVPPHSAAGSEGKLRIVLFLRSAGYPIFWEEVIRTIRMLGRLQDTYLIVVHHPRTYGFDHFVRAFPDLAPRREENLQICVEDLHSSALVRWADVILDVGTSVVFEAIKLDKPVLEMEYLHANYATLSHYMKQCVMMCRDNLYDCVQEFIRNGTRNFYDSEERRKFIREVIDVPDGNVLPRYVDLLSRMLCSS
jgi:hypothetical protein